MNIHDPRCVAAIRTILFASLACFAACAAYGTDVDVNVECAQVDTTVIPEGERPDTQRAEGLASCDAEDLYFGITRERDLTAARDCAYLQRGSGSSNAFGYYGAGILTMLYANGIEVKRNLALARKFACEVGRPGDMQGLLRNIAELESAKPDELPALDVCEHRYSGPMETVCAEHDARLKGVARAKELQTMTRGWKTAQKAALAKLLSAGGEYFDAASYDAGFHGSAAQAERTSLRSGQEGDLLALVQRFESGQLPSYCPTCFRTADAALNQAYRRLLHSNFDDPDRTFGITKAGIRESQRKWLAYRDAWVAFGAVRYPRVPADAWRTYFTTEREHGLQAVLSLAVER